MKHARLLIVEDDIDIQEMLAAALSVEGYGVEQATTVRQAWEIIQNQRIDMVLLDWMLPDRSGIELLHRIRKHDSQLPVIMVTAKTEEEDRIRGLDVGADDYLTKPFSLRELGLRIQAVLRRVKPEAQSVSVGELTLDPVSNRVMAGENEIMLSPTEFRLLHYFMTHIDRVFSRAQLLDQVWGSQVYVEERTVDVHIRRLRKQLDVYDMAGMLQTVHGRGYRFSRQS